MSLSRKFIIFCDPVKAVKNIMPAKHRHPNNNVNNAKTILGKILPFEMKLCIRGFMLT